VPAALPHLCGSCSKPITPGSLRCKHCGAAFRGKKAEPQVEVAPRVEMRGAGFSVSADLIRQLLDRKK
jgi:predicted amidophosphoribosyltransferase